jgi:GxxExxY protein
VRDEGSCDPWEQIPRNNLSTLSSDRISENILKFGREVEHPIYYDGIAVGARRADFIVDEKVVVELKAVINLEDVH